MKKILSLVLALLSALGTSAQADYFTPYKKTALRMPSVPLIVNDPYISFWSPYNNLNEGTTRHWDNQVKAMDGLLRVDGTSYRFMGRNRSTQLEAIAPMANRGRWACKIKTSSAGLPTNWTEIGASETGWITSYGAFGTKDEYDNIYTSWGTADIYIRRHINLTEADLLDDLYIVYSHDDKCEMYVNGIQIVNTDDSWNQNVKVHLTGEAKQSLVAGDNVVAFHVHNTRGGQLADFGLYRNKMGYHPGLTALAAMADAGAWTGKVLYSTPSTGWNNLGYNDSNWKEQQGAWGSGGNYPNCNTPWTATNSDIYIRRSVTLTAEDLKKDLWLVYSHDDVCQAYINGRRLVSTGETWVQNVNYNLTDDDKAVLKEGENIIAYHVHNTTGGALADIGLYAAEAGEKMATQKECHVLATNTYYKFECGPVILDVVFTAPMLMDDVDLMSTPVNYISYKVTSTDGQEHDVQFLFATTPELTVDNNMQPTISTVMEKNGIKYIKSGSKAQKVLGKAGDLITIDWGYLYLPNVNGTVCIGNFNDTYNTFYKTGLLPDTEASMPSTEEADMPILAYSRNLGKVSSASSYMMVAYDEVKDMRYMGVDYKGYWARNGKTITTAVEEMAEQYDDIMQRCLQQDQIIYDDALLSGNAKYAEFLSGCYRHCIAAHKIFQDNKGNMLFFSKENNSNGCVNTVDLTYPEAPLFLLYNTELMKGMCTSILDYYESDRWGFDFAAHDLGTYPHANGQVYSITRPDAQGGFAGNMPIEESANIVILAASISLIDKDMEWANKYWKTLTTWTDYLVENGLDPENQLCTDDFAGHLAHNANLSIKAIMGVAGYAKMCELRDEKDKAEYYMAKAKEMATSWVTLARDGTHYRLAFDRPGTWSQKYNMVWDKVWSTALFSETIKRQEIAYYNMQMKTYGLPLDSRSVYTKTDWTAWTACLTTNQTQFNNYMDRLYKYANETKSRVPLSDWYFTDSGDMVAFRARSVVGGHWMKVLMDKFLNGTVGVHAPQALQPQSISMPEWYDLSGRKLNGEPTEHGIYIYGSKKVSK